MDAFREAGRQRVGNVKHRPARAPVLENALQLRGELPPEPARIRQQCQPVEQAGDLQRFAPGSRRCARATWSARRRASARAMVRPCAVIV